MIYWTCTWKIVELPYCIRSNLDLDYLTGVRFILWNIWLRLKKHLDYLTGLGLILLYIQLGLIKRINQAEMPLEKYEDFLESTVKQFVIRTKCNSPTLDNVWCMKNQTSMLPVANLAKYFSYQTRVPVLSPMSKSICEGSSRIQFPFKVNSKLKSVSNRVFIVVSS